eukprot:4173608-Pleurochrysis_carterae.AAC.2
MNESIIPPPGYFYPSGYPSYLIRRTYTYGSRLGGGGLIGVTAAGPFASSEDHPGELRSLP